MDVASLFGARHPAHAEDLRVATASARTAHACLACLFVSTMVGFTLLRAAGLKRVLVPRSGIIGVGVAWTIATGTLLALRVSDATALALAPGTPAHALAVVFPAQTAFLSMPRPTTARAPPRTSREEVALAFAFALFALNLARAIGASAPEVLRGAPRADGTREELDVVETLVDVLVALARAAAGITLALAGAETNGAVGCATGTVPVHLLVRLRAGAGAAPMGPMGPRAFGDEPRRGFRGRAVGGAARVSYRIVRTNGALRTQAVRAAPGFVSRYAIRAAAACAAHWCGLLAVKLAPGAYATRDGETKREETKKDR